MTTIEITIGGKPIFRQTATRQLSEQEIRELVREGLTGIDKRRATIKLNGHEYRN